MPSFNVADAKRTPQIVIRDGKGDVVTVVTPRDLQVGFEGSPGALILKGALDINAFVLQLSNPADAGNIIVSNDKIAYFILNDSGVPAIVKLPTPPANPGQTHIIKDYRGSASSVVPLTITTTDGSTIDGQPTQSITVPFGAIMFVWTGQGWVSLALGASGAGAGAPNNARYVVWGTEVGLSNSRVIAVTSGHLTLDTTAPSALLGLANAGTPGTYTFPSQITVDSQGRVTSIQSTTGSGGNADPGAQYVVMALTASLTNERVVSASTGIRITDGGANGPVTWQINNSVVATISGSTFTGATLHNAGLSGSLTRLVNGQSYLVAGTGITITSQSNGQVTIIGQAGSSSIDAPINATYLTLTADGTLTSERIFSPINGLKFTDGGAGGVYNLFIDDRVVATISGSTFSGVTNHTAGLSGSLTRLTNGQSYLVAGANIIITSQSNGQITISSTASGSAGTGSSGTGTGDSGASYVVMSLTGSLSNERVLTAGTGISITDGGANGPVTIALIPVSSQSADVYDGYNTGSLNWGNNTSWTDYTNIVTNTVDRISNNIVRSGSTWTVSKTGYFEWHSDFNYAMSTGYLAFRLSGSTGTIIQQTSYDNASDAAGNARLDGIIQLTSGSSFKLQYVRKVGSAGSWNVSDPIGSGGDTENMVTGRITVARIADPLIISQSVNNTIISGAVIQGGTGSCKIDYHDTTYNPIGLWQLSGNMLDSSTSAHHLGLQAGTQRYTNMGPQFRGAMFDGSTLFLSTGSVPSSMVLTGAATVEFIANFTPGGNQVPFQLAGATGDVNGSENFLLEFIVASSGMISYFAERDSGTNIQFDFTSASVNFNEVAHYAMTRDVSGTVRVYVNGSKLETSLALNTPNTGVAALSTARIHIGADNGAAFSLGTSPCSRTSIASVKLIGRQLSDEEVYSEYLHTIGAMCGGESTSTGGGGADVSASYVVLGTTSSLPNERVLTAGSGISIQDNGPNGTVVISATGGGGGGTPITASTDWTTLFDIDFTTAASATYTANTLDAVLGGYSWILENMSNADSIGVLPGVGLVIDTNGNSSDQFTSVYTAPSIIMPMSRTLADYRQEDYELRLWVNVEITGSDANFEVTRGGFARYPFFDGNTRFFDAYAKGFSGGAVAGFDNFYNGGVTSITLANPTTLNAFCIHQADITRGDLFAASVAPSASFPSHPSSSAGYKLQGFSRYVGNVFASTVTGSGDIAVHIEAFTVNANNSFWTTYRRIKLEARRRSLTVTGTFGTSTGGGADVSASYVVIGTTSSLPNERMLSAGTGINIQDNGPNGTVVISATGGGGAGEVSASYVVLGLTSSLANERVLTVGAGLTLTDNGPNSSVVIAAATGSTRLDQDGDDIIVWRLNELSGSRIINYGSSGSAGDITGSARLVYGRAGVYDSAIDFRGYTIPTFASGSPGVKPKDTNINVSLWIYPYQFMSGVLLVKNLTTGTYDLASPIILRVDGAYGYPFLQLRSTDTASNYLLIEPSRSLALYTWNHLGFSLSGSGSSSVARFYLNGDFLKTMTISGTLDFSSHGWWGVGGVPLTGAEAGDYKLNEVRVANVVRNDQWWRDIYLRGLRGSAFSGAAGGGSGQAFVTGTWRDAVNQFITTGSVSIDSQNRTAAQVGSDVFFFVSGNTGLSGTSAGKIAAFGGDVKITGTLSVGTGSLYIDSNEVRWDANTKIFKSGSNLKFQDATNPSGFTLTQLAQSGSAGGGGFVSPGFVQANYAFVTNSNELSVAPGNTFVGFQDLTASITTTGSPVLIAVNANFFAISGSPQTTAIFSLYRNGVNVGHPVWGTQVAGTQVIGFNNNASFWFADFPAAGTYSYALVACAPTGSGKLNAAGQGPTTLMAFEMKGANVVTASSFQQQAVPGGAIPGLSASILPTRGPVLAIASLNYSNDGAGNWAWNNIRRDATDLGSSFGIQLTVGTTAGEMQNMSAMVLDTPSVGATHTYSVRATNGAGTGVIGRNGVLQTLILWEIPDVNYKYSTNANVPSLGASYTDVIPSTPSHFLSTRGRPVFMMGCVNINTTSTTGRSGWSFLKNGTSVVSQSKGLQILDGENNNDWNKAAIMSHLDLVVTGASLYQFAGFNISGSNNVNQGPTLGTFFIYELDAGTDVVSGPWIDGGNKIKTTSSVAISDGENIYADQKGLDLHFYVSGSIAQTGSGAKNALFGGDTYFSGAVVYLGGMIYNTVTVTGSYFIGRDDYLIGVAQPNGSSSVIFTPTGSIRNGRAYKVVDVAGNASTGSITISGSAGSLILGSSTYPLAINWAAVEIIRLGSNWIIG